MSAIQPTSGGSQLYTSGDYLEKNPTWHVEHSAWKAAHVRGMLNRNGIRPKSICEVGCGAGEILHRLQETGDPECTYWGYEISPQAYELCRPRENSRLRFTLGDILDNHQVQYDVILLMDVIEHMEDYFRFLRDIREKAQFKILHIPLDLSVQGLVRGVPLKVRKTAGHLHYFSKAISLCVLEECGYRVLDQYYTCGAIDFPSGSIAARLARLPRRLSFALHRDLAAFLLGGYSLLVLAT